MEVKAITEALRYLQSKQYRRSIIVTDSMSTLQKINNENIYADWEPIISSRKLKTPISGFSPATLAFKATSEQTVLQALLLLTKTLPFIRTTRGKQT